MRLVARRQQGGKSPRLRTYLPGSPGLCPPAQIMLVEMLRWHASNVYSSLLRASARPIAGTQSEPEVRALHMQFVYAMVYVHASIF
mmetsp:Transcript_21876/g.41934  ORF Transcript_21876/g.41934 Transcript_21876/m.41934 type:complete len:86 (+) Transcript_21876:1272-1529(+)